MSFGGAGGLHAVALARALRIPRVLAPIFPGALSALGILISDVVKDVSRTVMLPPDSPKLEKHFREDGGGGKGLRTRSLDMRYVGQGFELNVPHGKGAAAAFHEAHRQRYGYADAARPIEVVNARVRFCGGGAPGALREAEAASRRRRAKALVGVARAGAAAGAGTSARRGTGDAAKIYDRALLVAGDAFAGPAIVAEYSAATVVPRGARASVDAWGNIVIEV